jgi:hypothetical protein
MKFSILSCAPAAFARRQNANAVRAAVRAPPATAPIAMKTPLLAGLLRPPLPAAAAAKAPAVIHGSRQKRRCCEQCTQRQVSVSSPPKAERTTQATGITLAHLRNGVCISTVGNAAGLVEAAALACSRGRGGCGGPGTGLGLCRTHTGVRGGKTLREVS